jgi:DNA-binding CsgD family transcriptional regulator
MFDKIKTNPLLSKMLNLQKDKYPKDADKNVTLKDSYINAFSISDRSVRIIFDHVNMKILNVTDNVEHVIGFSGKDFTGMSLSFVFDFFTLDHYNFLYIWLKWAFSLHSKVESIDLDRIVNVRQAICGVKVKHKKGHDMRILLRHFVLEETEDHIPIVAAITIDDISHLIKSDFYWGRIESGHDVKRIHHMISTDKISKPHDILTDREIETLRLLAEGKESKEIGKLLYISSHTVDNHRRNMINRIGVRDTTGLVQICRMIGII